jgi:hypothetical protein
MKLTNMGQVQVTAKELVALRLKHLFSATDIEPTDLPAERRCGSATSLTGYTEWQSDADVPISIGWDWCIGIRPTCTGSALFEQAAYWRRNDLPHTNIQLLDEHGRALTWEDNLRVLATWVDAQDWQTYVTKAISAANH